MRNVTDSDGQATPGQLAKKWGVSPQRAWQIQQQAKGNCPYCGKPAGGKFLCPRHRKLCLERNRRAYQRRKEQNGNV